MFKRRTATEEEPPGEPPDPPGPRYHLEVGKSLPEDRYPYWWWGLYDLHSTSIFRNSITDGYADTEEQCRLNALRWLARREEERASRRTIPLDFP